MYIFMYISFVFVEGGRAARAGGFCLLYFLHASVLLGMLHGHEFQLNVFISHGIEGNVGVSKYVIVKLSHNFQNIM